MNVKKLNMDALMAAEKALDMLANGGTRGMGVIPAHYRNTRNEVEATLSLVRLAIQNATLFDLENNP